MTPRERQVAAAILTPGATANRWFKPRDAGGFGSSHHADRLYQMQRKGWVQAEELPPSPRSTGLRPTYRYRFTLAGVDEFYRGAS